MGLKLFNNLAQRYDFINHLLSFGIDLRWRKKAVKRMNSCEKVLDVAIGTADFSLEILKKGKAREIVGVDPSENMMDFGKQKMQENHFADQVEWVVANAEKMPFQDESFDAVVCSYGVRNFSDRAQGLREMQRVLKTNGQLIILEFGFPKNMIINALYKFYFKTVMIPIGAFLSHDKPAFQYFYHSIERFPRTDIFANEITKAGFKNINVFPLTFGISNLYVAEK